MRQNTFEKTERNVKYKNLESTTWMGRCGLRAQDCICGSVKISHSRLNSRSITSNGPVQRIKSYNGNGVNRQCHSILTYARPYLLATLTFYFWPLNGGKATILIGTNYSSLQSASCSDPAAFSSAVLYALPSTVENSMLAGAVPRRKYPSLVAITVSMGAKF